MKTETSLEAVKATPALGVGGLVILGYPVETWAAILACVYTLVLIVDKLPALIERVRQFVNWLKED